MTAAIKPMVLARLNTASPIVDPSTGQPLASFVQTINNAFQNITAALTNLEDLLAQVVAANGLITTAQDSADAAQTAATAAQTFLEAAQSKVTQTALFAAVMGSFTAPQNVLTAMANADHAIITIVAHQRHYGDGTVVAVKGGTVLSLALSTTYAVFYSDPAHAGGTVKYIASTSLQDAAQIGAVHSVGVITTPPENGNTTGAGWRGPGIL